MRCHHPAIKLWYSRKKSFVASMLEYLHFVPGRLRLKIRALRHRRKAAEAEAKVAAIPNVTTATANPLTGSLTINFDRQRLSIGDLWKRLQTLGYVSEDCPEPSVTRGNPIDGSDADRLARVVSTALLEAVVQHSARVLVRAML
jgi:hypothetical protein